VLTGCKILVADDNPLNLKIASIILQKRNAEVTTVANGREVIEALDAQHFDLVLMDIHMPVMDGLETTKYIRTVKNNNIPILALTASDLRNDHQEYRNAGMNGSIAKPIDIEGLETILTKLGLTNNIEH
jgi:CheY-like chemotaxis protein